ncbi:hypothetical protein BG000_006605 [Podila horticola]|nr:hypothetical protein BG000_006605 [Podila horticola]
MKILLSVASAFLAFAGLAAAGPAFAPQASDSDARRLRLEPEFASLFTNASFVRDPTYQKDMAELNEMISALNAGNGRSNKEYRYGRVPAQGEGCVGKAENPTRSMYFDVTKDCNRDGWTHDFQLPVQVQKIGPMHSLNVWEAADPHRMNIVAPDLDLVPTGWKYRYYIPAYTISYPMTPSGLKTIKSHLSKIVSIHKRGLGDSDVNYLLLNATVSVILYRALHYLVHGIYTASQGSRIQQFNDIDEVRSVAQGLYNRYVNIELVRTRIVPGGFEGNLVTIELRADGVTAATLMMDENVHYGQTWIREALNTSMMDRVTVLLVRVRDIDNGRYRGYIYGRGPPIDLGFQ